jgi:DNA-binding MarR family transcriptional regulator
VKKTARRTAVAADSIDVFLADWRRERPDLDPWPLAIIGRVARLSAHLQRRAEGWLAPLGLTWETFSLIAALRRAGTPYEQKPSDLLRLSLLTSGAMTNRIDRVEEQGLVRRLADPNDRRGVIVKLTPAGRALADKAIARHFEAAAQLLGGLNEQDRAQLARLLAGLLVSFEAPAPADGTAGTLGKAARPVRRPASRR